MAGNNPFAMKKILLLLAPVVVLISCQKDQETTTLQLQMQGFSQSGKTYITQNDEENISCWTPNGFGDEFVRINDSIYPVFVPAGNSSQTISINDVVTADCYYALYPTSLRRYLPISSSFDVDLPENEVYRTINYSNKTLQLSDAPMAGKTTSNGLTLRPLEGMLACEITGSGWLEYIEVQSSTSPLSGPAAITISNDAVTLTPTGNQKTKRLINIHTQLSEQPKTFYINLPKFAAQTCHILLGIKSTEDGVTHSYKKDLTQASIIQGQIISFPISCPNATPSGFSLFADGSEYQPYIIHSANISTLATNATTNKHFILEEDITINSTITSFNGTLDGNTHIITLSHPLFSRLSGTVKNLTTAGNITQNNGSTNLGSIAEQVTGAIINCTNNANITFSANTTSKVGGICGYASTATSTIQQCTNNGKITNQGTNTGGIIGNSECPIMNCVNNGKIISNSTRSIDSPRFIGGICGQTVSHIFNCSNNDSIIDTRPEPSQQDFFGGIVGCLKPSASIQITNCSNIGHITISGTRSFVGGIAGKASNCNILNCYAKCNISAAYSSGIIDRIDSNTTIQNCYFYGALSSTSNFFAGIARRSGDPTTFNNCYSAISPFTRANNVTSTDCNTLSSPTTITGGGNLVDALNSYCSNITGARSWTVQNGIVVFAQ